MSSPSPSVQGLHVTRSFGEGLTTVTVLHDVSVSFYPSEVTLLMGPSGSGKTTLMAILSGLLHPDRGQVLSFGMDLAQLSARERRQFRLRHCGFIFQGYNLFPSLTAQEQLEMVLRWGEGVSTRDARRRVREMLELLGLGGKGNHVPTLLSGGEKQRVAIGRALIKNPELCFADEPTSALDWTHGQHVVELLASAARDRGATVLIVTHDPRLLPFADRVYHLEDGRLKEQPGNGLQSGIREVE